MSKWVTEEHGGYELLSTYEKYFKIDGEKRRAFHKFGFISLGSIAALVVPLSIAFPPKFGGIILVALCLWLLSLFFYLVCYNPPNGGVALLSWPKD